MTDLRKAAEMALEALEKYSGVDQRACDAEEALQQALAQPNDFIYSQNKAFRINPSTGDFGIGSAPAKTLEHKDWCASLTQVLACHPPRPAPCNCKPEYVDAVNMSQERVDETAKDRHEPVAWVNHDKDGEIEWGRNGYRLPVGTPLYTAPPKRGWVGLTDEEINGIYKTHHDQYGKCQTGGFDYERSIEAKLKEKNT